MLMIKEKVYLATPYFSEEEIVMELRYEEALEAASRLLKKGYLVYSPIVHCHPIAKIYKLPRDHNFWLSYDMSFIIGWAQILYVQCMENWDESEGIKSDVSIAHAAGVDVRYSISSPLE